MGIAKKTLVEAIICIWILALIVVLAGMFFVKNPLSYILGEVVGSLTASILYINMYLSIDLELDLTKDKAITHSRNMGIIRSIVEIGVLVAAFFLQDYILPYTVFAGLIARKFSALMVPFIDLIYRKYISKEPYEKPDYSQYSYEFDEDDDYDDLKINRDNDEKNKFAAIKKDFDIRLQQKMEKKKEREEETKEEK